MLVTFCQYGVKQVFSYIHKGLNPQNTSGTDPCLSSARGEQFYFTVFIYNEFTLSSEG